MERLIDFGDQFKYEFQVFDNKAQGFCLVSDGVYVSEQGQCGDDNLELSVDNVRKLRDFLNEFLEKSKEVAK